MLHNIQNIYKDINDDIFRMNQLVYDCNNVNQYTNLNVNENKCHDKDQNINLV